jgi:putative membrane protein
MESFFVGLASLIHLYIFTMESLLWGRPRTNRTFGISQDVAEHNRLFAFNQGFYNLFLALGAAGGIAADLHGDGTLAISLKAYTCLSMFGAAVVLLFSQPKLLRAVLIQGVPPALGLIALGARCLH